METRTLMNNLLACSLNFAMNLLIHYRKTKTENKYKLTKNKEDTWPSTNCLLKFHVLNFLLNPILFLCVKPLT